LIRKLFQKLFTRPVLWYMKNHTSKPDKERIFTALDDLYQSIIEGDENKGLVIPFDINTGKFIIFSDHHKGNRNGADDFMICEPNYLAALDHYKDRGFHYLALGDCEELWENVWPSIKKNHQPAFEKERAFIPSNAFIKIFGNHDLYWDNDPFAPLQLKELYGEDVPIHEGVVLETKIGERTIHIFCTHGHQGDLLSDGNWFSKFFVSRIWAPFQSFLRINPNTPAYDAALKTLHNAIMYEWSSHKQDLYLVTGHTHQPVFDSLTHLERLYRELLNARKEDDKEKIDLLQEEIKKRKFEYENVSEDYLHLKPCYFNAGCCCFNDGDITGIEIDEGCFRLIKWSSGLGSVKRLVLEERKVE
jgi:hypothetical protein